MAHLLKLGNLDDVAVALQSIGAGEYISAFELTTISDIPAGHKVALRAIPEGQPVRKFKATSTILPGVATVTDPSTPESLPAQPADGAGAPVPQ